MRAYYEARAREYDDWWLGEGRFAERDRPGWVEEAGELVAVLAELPPARTLDVACGTGYLTRHLRGDVTGLDQSPAMVELARARIPGGRAMVGEAVPLPFADRAFERVLTGHFYGHLVEGERHRFLSEARRVAPELVVVDSALRDGVEPEEQQQRVLGDGTRHAVYKRYFTGAGLADELGGGEVLMDGRWFVVVRSGQRGVGRPSG
jgi:demethylmenaquinone methyltransferase/2-methoxy-6-polyprenyl-1,4-benzoquinol methylase